VGVALALLCIVIYLYVRFVANVQRLLGPPGTQIAMRLFAFAIFCFGIQILWVGLSELPNSLRPHLSLRMLHWERRALANHRVELNQGREDRDGEGGADNGERDVELGLQCGDQDGLLYLVL
jgi:hypothetical protein